MSNSAYITTRKGFEEGGIGVYLHWNGGRDSVEGFLEYCKLKKYRPPEQDGYGWARLATIIGNFFGGNLSVGIENFCFKGIRPCYDNGVYIIENWQIVGREFFAGKEQAEYDLQEMLLAIDHNMPAYDQLTREFIISKEWFTAALQESDEVYLFDDSYGKPIKTKVIGFGNGVVNGCNVSKIPYTNAFPGEENNIRNYIFTDTIKVVGLEY